MFSLQETVFTNASLRTTCTTLKYNIDSNNIAKLFCIFHRHTLTKIFTNVSFCQLVRC